MGAGTDFDGTDPDAQPGTRPRLDEFRRVVAGDRQREPTGYDHGVNADKAALSVSQRTSGVTWGQADRGLDPILAAESAQRPLAMHYPGGEGADEAERVADGQDQFPGPERAGVTERDGGEAASVNLDGGQVAPAMPRGDLALKGPAVPQLDLGPILAGDMGVGYDKPVLVPDNARARTRARRPSRGGPGR